MGPKRKHARQAPQMRSRTTRSRGKPIVTNPEESSQMLDAQLRQLGLYAAHTIGDGNCLFRALSDQLYGTPSYHLKLRQDICDWIEAHKERYAPFVEDERGLEHHLSCMRQPATYGGHLELSAFAHMTKRNVKVIQPGLVYVIEWAAGGDFADEPAQAEASATADDSTLDSRQKRRQRRERLRSASDKTVTDDTEPSTTQGTVYVAYHDWEHFSSIRNLRGPHTGLPNVEETPAPDADQPPPPSSKKKPDSKAKAKQSKAPKREKAVEAAVAEAEEASPPTPSQIPLPGSASPSPPPSSAPSSQASAFPSVSTLEPHSYRSPKRTFDESSASSQAASESSQSAAKRAKSSSRPASTLNEESTAVSALPNRDLHMDTDDMDTPDLSASGSSADSVSSLSPMSSPEPTPPPPDPPAEKPMTRRQRKKLGLPKPRAAAVASTTARTRSAGKIVIPGGRFQKQASKAAAAADETSEEDPEANAEWRKNGTGRLDVRGFRELKI